MEQKDINEKLKDFWTSPWNTNGYLVYKQIVENIFLENWSLDKSAFREFIFYQLILENWPWAKAGYWHEALCGIS